MALLQIKLYPDPILKEVAAAVTDFDDKLAQLLNDMRETMYHENGIGLAAPQIGISRQIAVVDVSEDASNVVELINPKIVWNSGSIASEEGCLSIPEYRDTIKRNKEILVQAQDRSGSQIEIQADGILAICMQHEIDHLNGILFVDHMSRLKRELFRRWYSKQYGKG